MEKFFSPYKQGLNWCCAKLFRFISCKWRGSTRSSSISCSVSPEPPAVCLLWRLDDISLSQDSNISRQKIGLFFLKELRIKTVMKAITISLLCCVNLNEIEVLIGCLCLWKINMHFLYHLQLTNDWSKTVDRKKPKMLFQSPRFWCQFHTFGTCLWKFCSLYILVVYFLFWCSEHISRKLSSNRTHFRQFYLVKYRYAMWHC